MTTYYKCTRPDGTDFRTGTIDYAAALVSGELGELREERLNLCVLFSDPPTLAEVAGRAGQHEVVHVRTASPRRGDDVVDVVDASVIVEELEHAAPRQDGPRRSGSAVLADAPIALRDCGSDGVRDVAAVGHSKMVALVVAYLVAPWVAGVGRTWETPVERTVGR